MRPVAETLILLPPRHRSLMTARPTRAHRRAATVALTMLATAALLALPFARSLWPVLPDFQPATGAAIVVLDLIIACLLLGQASVARAGMPLRLAAAYVFAAVTLLPYMLWSQHGAGAALPPAALSDHSAAGGLWCFRQGGFAVAISLYAWTCGGNMRSLALPAGAARRVAVVAAPALVLSLFLLLQQLPPLEAPGAAAWWPLLHRSMKPLVLACNLAALAGVILRLRARTTVHLWLAVAMFAGLIDVGLTLAGNDAFSIGWYLGRLAGLLTSALMLVALISEVMVLYAGLARDNIRLETQAQTDSLTRLANRRCFDARMDQEWRRACRDGSELSLLLIDIDHFKEFNDRYGHPAGDACLRRVARAIRDQVWRAADLAARYGGEEFAVLLPSTNLDGALAVAEWIRCSVHALGLAHSASVTGTLTVSVGVAALEAAHRGLDVHHLLDEADRALYRAKALGRDRVEYAEIQLAPNAPAPSLG